MTASPINNEQPYLALNELILLEGIFPGRPDPGYPNAGDGSYTLGMMRLFAGNFAWENSAFANGQALTINQNTALFSLLGTTYGGDGRSTFELPDLRGDFSLGAGQGT